MTATATETTSLIAFKLPSTPSSVQMARFYVRSALASHDLAGYAEDAETITSELGTNAIEHAGAQVASRKQAAAGNPTATCKGKGHG